MVAMIFMSYLLAWRLQAKTQKFSVASLKKQTNCHPM